MNEPAPLHAAFGVGGTSALMEWRHAASRFDFGDVTVDMRTRSVRKKGTYVQLAPKEFDLLVHLIRSGGIIMSRDALQQQVWGYAPGLTSRTVDQHLSRLRIKLEDDPHAPVHFITVRKAGYRFERSPG